MGRIIVVHVYGFEFWHCGWEVTNYLTADENILDINKFTKYCYVHNISLMVLIQNLLPMTYCWLQSFSTLPFHIQTHIQYNIPFQVDYKKRRFSKVTVYLTENINKVSKPLLYPVIMLFMESYLQKFMLICLKSVYFVCIRAIGMFASWYQGSGWSLLSHGIITFNVINVDHFIYLSIHPS